MRQAPVLLPLLALAVASSAVFACGAKVDDDPADESADNALTGSLSIGTELVTTTSVNLREGAGTTFRVIRLLKAGTTAVIVNRTAPAGSFYNVKVGSDEGWVHSAYLAPRSGAQQGGGPATTPENGACVERKLTFSADAFPSLPAAGSLYVWGANATGGASVLDPPYSGDFLSRARQAHERGLEVFAYLEGPCGDTGGVDDGERARCATIHNSYNQRFSPGTPDTAKARWKPFTLKQLTTSGKLGVDYCEIDNLENNVKIALDPLLAEIKVLYDAGKIHCRMVLKNVDVGGIDAIRANVAPTPADATFIAPFHIFEADDTHQKPALDAAMKRLKGPGAVTIISTDTNHYGGAFTPDRFLTCK